MPLSSTEIVTAGTGLESLFIVDGGQVEYIEASKTMIIEHFVTQDADVDPTLMANLKEIIEPES
jgi:hypothetical protein